MLLVFLIGLKKWNIFYSPFEKYWHINYHQIKYIVQASMVHQYPLFNTHKDVLPQSGTWEAEYVLKIVDENEVKVVNGRVFIKYF